MNKSNVSSMILTGITVAYLSVSGCGGGDGFDPAPPPPAVGTAEGLWNGTTGDGRTFSGLVLDDGTYWFLYSAAGNSAVFGGAIQGNGSSSAGSFVSSTGLDFNFEGAGILPFTMAGTYTAKSKLSGTLTYAASVKSFTSTYDTDYDLTPSVSSISGTYTGEAITVNTGPATATVTVQSGGAISGASNGCSYTGMATPRVKGNVYDITVTFTGGNCDNGTDTVTGVAYYVTAKRELIGTALNGGRTNGFIFSGTRP
jgi:hypothetical protein